VTPALLRLDNETFVIPHIIRLGNPQENPDYNPQVTGDNNYSHFFFLTTIEDTYRIKSKSHEDIYRIYDTVCTSIDRFYNSAAALTRKVQS
jgi:hypothetical protein